MCDNKTINFPQVDPDIQLEQMLNSPTQRARRGARRKEDKLWENTNSSSVLCRHSLPVGPDGNPGILTQVGALFGGPPNFM